MPIGFTVDLDIYIISCSNFMTSFPAFDLNYAGISSSIIKYYLSFLAYYPVKILLSLSTKFVIIYNRQLFNKNK